jgi:hypothetical protein
VCIYPFAGIEVIQSFNAVITTTRMKMVVVPNMNVVRKGIVIESVINLGCGLGGFLAKRNLSRSLKLPTANTRVVETPHMVFTNPIMTTHIHKTIN